MPADLRSLLLRINLAGRKRNPYQSECLEEMEALHIRRTLEMSRGRIEGKDGAAVLLGINPSTLRARMRKLHIPFGRKQILQPA